MKVKGRQEKIKSFEVFIREGDFNKFERVRTAIVAQTHGELILNSRFDPCLLSEFVTELQFEQSSTKCRPEILVFSGITLKPRHLITQASLN